MKKIYLQIFLVIYFNTLVKAQNGVVISEDANATLDNSAILEVESNNKGMLIPKVVLNDFSSANPITNPAIGLLIYNTSTANGLTQGFYFWAGTQWSKLVTLEEVNTGGGNNQDLELNEDVLSLTGDATTVDLSPYKDSKWTEEGGFLSPSNNTVNNISMNGVTIATNGNMSTGGQISTSGEISAVGNIITNGSIIFDDGTLQSTAATDHQNLSLNGKVLQIDRGTAADLSPIVQQDYGLFTIPSIEQNNPIFDGATINFSRQLEGNLNVDGLGNITLNSNKTYKLLGSIYTGGINGNPHNVPIQFFNGNTPIGIQGQVISPNSTQSVGSQSTAVAIIKTFNQTNVSLRILENIGASSITSRFSYLLVEEIK